jgi:hypothetical protein
MEENTLSERAELKPLPPTTVSVSATLQVPNPLIRRKAVSSSASPADHSPRLDESRSNECTPLRVGNCDSEDDVQSHPRERHGPCDEAVNPQSHVHLQSQSQQRAPLQRIVRKPLPTSTTITDTIQQRYTTVATTELEDRAVDNETPLSSDPSNGSRLSKGSTIWNPLWLRHSVLLSFSIAWMVLCVAVIMLYEYGRGHQGLSTQISSNHYSWTYGPTAGKPVPNHLYTFSVIANTVSL